jgi:hypothetical protein
MIEVSPDLLAFLREEEARSRNDELLEEAETALKSYNGEEYGDEEDGRSRVVTRDVAEVIDQMEVSVLRVFVSGDRVVEFEPKSQEQVQAADDATEEISRDFTRNGYRLLHDWFKEGNLAALGIVKSAVEVKKERVEFHVPAMLMDDLPEGVQVIEGDEPFEDEDGILKLKVAALQDGKPTFKDYLVPLEEFRVSPDARTLDEAPYVAHAVEKTLSELVEMGFDRETVEDLHIEDYRHTLADARSSFDDNRFDERKGMMRKVILLEEYARFDADGDGIAELLCVHRVGETVLAIEACDYQPFVAYCPFPMPGRLVGQSLADKVIDIQRVNTVLNRLALDGLYYNLAPGTLLHESAIGDTTIDDLLNWRPNRVVRWQGSVAPIPEQRNDVSAVAFQAMEFMIGQREARTGITRLNQGLDADALNKTATGTALMQAQGQQMEEYLARNFGESVAQLFRLKLKQRKRYGQPIQLRVDGQFRDIDPSQYDEDMDVVIRVGLGSGKKEQRLAYRMQMLGIQQQVMAAQLPIVSQEHIYKSIAGLVRDANLGSPADFVADPETLKDPQTGQMPPQPPSPEEQKAQAELQLQQAKMQGDQQIQAQKLDGMREEAMLKAQLAQQVAETEAQLARDKAEFEAQQARDKFEFEKALALEKLAFEERRSERDAARRDYETDAKVSKNREGGKLDE